MHLLVRLGPLNLSGLRDQRDRLAQLDRLYLWVRLGRLGRLDLSDLRDQRDRWDLLVRRDRLDPRVPLHLLGLLDRLDHSRL